MLYNKQINNKLLPPWLWFLDLSFSYLLLLWHWSEMGLQTMPQKDQQQQQMDSQKAQLLKKYKICYKILILCTQDFKTFFTIFFKRNVNILIIKCCSLTIFPAPLKTFSMKSTYPQMEQAHLKQVVSEQKHPQARFQKHC